MHLDLELQLDEVVLEAALLPIDSLESCFLLLQACIRDEASSASRIHHCTVRLDTGTGHVLQRTVVA